MKRWRKTFRQLKRIWRRGDLILRIRLILTGAVCVVAAMFIAALLISGIGSLAGKGMKTEQEAVHSGSAENGQAASAGVSGSGAVTAPSQAPAVPTPTPTPTPTPPPQPVMTEITVSCVGDCTLARDSEAEYDMSLTEAWDSHEPGWFFDNVRHYFEQDDLTIVNFEGTLTESEDRTENRFAFKAPAEYVQILTGSGVEAANLANNHSFDYGEQGFEDTKQVLDEAGIRNFGYDRSIVMEVNGIKVGLTGTYELVKEMGVADQLEEQIRYVKEQGAQLVISSFHWGDEKSYEPTDIQVALAHLAIDSGADLVIGHHPHVLQPVEVYKGKRICYSLGNFCFGGNVWPYDMDSAIYQQKFVFRDGVLDPDTDIYRLIPVRITSADDYNNFQPTPAEGSTADRINAKLSGHAYADVYEDGPLEAGDWSTYGTDEW